MSYMTTVIVDETLCIGCGECCKVCPSSALALSREPGSKAVVRVLAPCMGCDHCAAVCPVNSLKVPDLESDVPGSGMEAEETPRSKNRAGQADLASLIRLMAWRRSCRVYKDRPVSREQLEDLVRIGITAPSGTNSQAWTFTILPDRPALLNLGQGVAGFFKRLNRLAGRAWLRKGLKLLGKPELDEYHREHFKTVQTALGEWESSGRDMLFHGAAAAVMVGSGPGASCPAEDALLATGHMLLAAQAMGLATCLIGFAVEAMRRDKAIKRSLGIPDAEEVYAVMAVGHGAEKYTRTCGRREPLIRWAEKKTE